MSRIRSLLGYEDRWRRYQSGEYTELEDIADPTTRKDETKTTWREWATKTKTNTIFSAFLVLVGVGLIVYFSQVLIKLSTGLLSNPWFQRFAWTGFVAVIAGVFAIRKVLGIVKRYDWLVLPKDNGGVKWYLGFHREGDDTQAPLFVPVKGFTLFGFRGRPYKIVEVSQELAQQYSSSGRDPEDPAVIRMQPEFASARKTWMGTVVTQPTSGLDLDESGNESCLKAEIPQNYASEQALIELSSTVDDLRLEIRDLEDKRDKLRSQRNDWKQDAMKRREEIREELKEDTTEIAEPFMDRDGRKSKNGTSSGDVPKTDLQQIEDNLTADD